MLSVTCSDFYCAFLVFYLQILISKFRCLQNDDTEAKAISNSQRDHLALVCSLDILENTVWKSSHECMLWDFRDTWV